jgi:hypothetical protein
MEMKMKTKTTTSTFEAKDARRITDMIRKAKGNTFKLGQLARNMARSITSADKALRRCHAAEDANYFDIATIFQERYPELSGTGLGAAASDVAEPKTNRELEFEAKKDELPNLRIEILNVKFVRKETPNAKPAIFFWDETKGNSMYDMFMQRYTPKQIFTPHLPEVLRPVGLEDHKVGWSQYAGCKACPCSPGFVVDARDYEYDIHVHYHVTNRKVKAKKVS